jgi:hypothetical protein
MSGRAIDDTDSEDPSGGLIRFVRQTLGCGCADEVLARISLDESEAGESGLDVGGRLLVRVLEAEDVDRLIESFPDTVERLLVERDRREFRRLRLVVCHTHPVVMGEVLDGMLELIETADERVYVHALEHDCLPSILA